MLTILSRVQRGEWELVGSDVLDLEIGQNPAEEGRGQVRAFLTLQTHAFASAEGERNRMRVLTPLGFKPLDALHVACAEAAKCDVLLTTDDRFLRKARSLASELSVRIENPLVWITEQLGHEHD